MSKKVKKEKVLWQWTTMEYLSYFLVFLVPLFYNNKYHLFSFGSQKALLITAVVLLMLIIYSWGIGVSDKLSFRFTPLHIVIGIFLIILTISSALGIDPLNSFFGRWREGISLILVYASTIFAFLIGFLIKRNRSFFPKIILVSFISSFLVLLISYTNVFGSEIFRSAATTLGNNSYAGAYLLFSACFGVGLFFYYLKIWQKISIALGTIIISFSPVFFSHKVLVGQIGLSSAIHKPFLFLGTANAATAGLIVASGIILCFLLIFSSKKIVKMIGLALFFILLSGVLYTGFQLVNPTSAIHRAYVEQKGENRFIAWDAAELSFIDHPLLGSGFNNYSYNYQKYFTSDIFKESYIELYFNQPHNIVLEYASNNGILGLLSFLSLLLFTFFAFFQTKDGEEKKYRNIKIALIGLLFGYFIQNLFGFDTPAIYLMLFLVIGIAIGESKKDWIFSVNEKQNNWFKSIAVFTIIFSFIMMIVFVFLPIKEFRRWGNVGSTNNIKERISLRDGMQDVSLIGGVSDSVYLEAKYSDLYRQNMNKINNSNKGIFIEEIQAMIAQIDSEIVKQQYDDRPYLLASQLLNMEMYINGSIDENNWNKSYNYMEKALNFNSQNPETYILLAQTYLLKKDFKNAQLTIEQAIVIAPGYKRSYDFARTFLKMKPDSNFEMYVNNMEKKWNPVDNMIGGGK